MIGVVARGMQERSPISDVPTERDPFTCHTFETTFLTAVNVLQSNFDTTI